MLQHNLNSGEEDSRDYGKNAAISRSDKTSVGNKKEKERNRSILQE